MDSHNMLSASRTIESLHTRLDALLQSITAALRPAVRRRSGRWRRAAGSGGSATLLRPLLLLSTLLSTAAIASEMVDPMSCRNGAFPSEQSDFALAKVVGTPRLFLLGDMDGCPAKGEPACRQRSYVISGDTVLTGRDIGRFRCAFFPNKGGGSSGWVDKTHLQTLPLATPKLKDWAGDWHNGDNNLRIRARGGQLYVKGNAFWPSANPADWPSTHLGEIEASATPKGATITLRDDICHMDVHWLGDALVVSDNAECGGMNVRFNGVYQRAAKR